MSSQRPAEQLRRDALAIWQAGVRAVASDRLVTQNIVVENAALRIVDQVLPLRDIRRIAVVGAGKAGSGMAQGLETALGDQLLRDKQVRGWVNVPADCLRPLRHIRLHAARPAGVNEPSPDGVEGARQILDLVEHLTQDDLCLCLLSGGGSALLPAPIDGITLQDKQAVTRHLSSSGANIQQLNTVRKQLSRIKGGGLARACRAGRLITLIISDVLGDPLDVIASGPTVPDTTTALDALDILEQFHAREAGIADAVFAHLQARAAAPGPTACPTACKVTHHVIGNNAVAVDAAGVEAERQGYSHAMVSARQLEGEADHIGRHLAGMARRMRHTSGPDCLISGGEPTVTLVDPSARGLGGRNQQLVLAALCELATASDAREPSPLEDLLILSGGTDGEDGPTDAAGAWADGPLERAARARGLVPTDYLQRNDAYRFFEPLGGLIKTGPTHTNVCDVRVVLVART
ncbi:MAG: glycerate kinase type-2 family protein [Pirellulaceae bacterium]